MSDVEAQYKQALYAWGVFFVLIVLINGTIPFIMGVDLHAWTSSPLKDMTINLLVYAVLFLIVPLILSKGWDIVRRPAFLFPLLVAVLAMTLRTFIRPTAALAVFILIFLHWRFDLSELGFRSLGWKSDILAISLFGVIYLAPSLLQAPLTPTASGNAILAGLDRLFFNPASTTENLFYYGFLAERLSHKTGRWMTPLIIATMYTAHEMSNPEYWYEGLQFPLVFIGVALTTSIYLWRRSIVVIWLGDGLGRFVSRLFTVAG